MKRMFIVLVALVTINLTMPFTQYATQTPESAWFSLPSASAYLPTAETLQNITQQMTQNKAVFGAALTGALGMGGYLAQKAYSSAKRIAHAYEAEFIKQLVKIVQYSIQNPDAPAIEGSFIIIAYVAKLNEIKSNLPSLLQNSQEFKEKMIELTKIIADRYASQSSSSLKDLKATTQDLEKVFVDICLLTLLPIINKEFKTEVKPFEKKEPVKKN